MGTLHVLGDTYISLYLYLHMKYIGVITKRSLLIFETVGRDFQAEVRAWGSEEDVERCFK
jgi:hypothetical protein